MKNRFLALALVFTLSLSFVACGNEKEKTKEEASTSTEKTETTEQTELEYNVDDYVTLGDYKGIEVTIEGEYEYSAGGFDKYVSDNIKKASIYVEDESQKEVLEDSIVNVDYVGSQDGVAFEGGSAEDQLIDVANNSGVGAGAGGFIEGFTSGLAGHSVGEEVAYEVTFPEQYQSAELAGQTVVFTFQINYVAKSIESKKELTDEIVSEKLGYDTVDDYMASLEESYKTTLEDNLKNDKETAVLNALINNCKVSEVPEALLQARVDLILAIQDRQYQQYGTTMKDYAESMGYDYNEMVASLTENVKESTETELILEAIAKAEGLEVDEEGYDKFVTDMYQRMGFADKESFYKEFSVDGYGGERYFKLAYLTEKASKFCIENAVVNATSTLVD